MRDNDYEVGYGKPPENGKFKKGVSGNPAGRPKKEPDLESQLLKEFGKKVSINENGKRKSITKLEAMMKQLANKTISGNIMATKLALPLIQIALVKAAERFRKSPSNPYLNMDDLTDEELFALVRVDVEKSLRPVLEKTIRAELSKSMSAELEKTIRAEIEQSIKDDANGRKPGNRRKIEE